MKKELTNVLGAEYFKDRIKATEDRVMSLDESCSATNARLLGFYQAIAQGMIRDLEIYEKSNK